MRILEDQNSDNYQIRGYSPGRITINDKEYSTSLIVSSSFLISPWPVDSISQLTPDQLIPLLESKLEIVLIGTGNNSFFLPTPLLRLFYEKKIGVESMDTLAACRTYTILSSEGRRVAAALILEKE